MANFAYTGAKKQIALGDIHWDTDDIRAILVMTNTTADTEQDVEFVGDITTLDECDGANYAREVLASEAVAQDNANNRAEFTASPLTWVALGAGTRQNQALILYKHVTNDADSPALVYIDTLTGVTFPFNGNGGDVTISPHAEGFVQIT